MKVLIRRIFSNSARLAIIIVAVFSIWMAGNLGAFGGVNKIVYDVVSYHAYTPAALIKKDIKLRFYRADKEQFDKNGMYWANIVGNGNAVIKTTCGLSILNLPFTIWPILLGDKAILTGYEMPFSAAICVSTIFYYLIGLFFLYKFLIKLNVTKNAIAFTIICLGLGTNLLTYVAVAPGNAHAYNFSLVTMLLYFSWHWHESPTFRKSIVVGILVGFLVLIRPTNIILCFVLLLFGNRWQLKKFVVEWKYTLLILVFGLLLVSPQLLYWKYTSGSYFFNSYVGERFYFTNPRWVEFLVGFRKGWFIYTPLVVLGLIGLIYSRSRNPYFLSGVVIILVFIYVNSSWWCWWFGGGHGARGMIEVYPLLAPGFAVFYEKYLGSRYKSWLYASMLLVAFNIKSVDLYRRNIIHFDSMTFKAFVNTTFKIMYTEEEKAELQQLYAPPNYAKALKGEDT